MGNERVLQVGVKAVIRDDAGRLLLLKKEQPFEGDTIIKWEIPGGRIDVGEPTIDALKREIKEETGLDVISIERVLAAQDILKNPKLHVVRITYLVTTAGEIVVNHSDTSDTLHSEARWYTLEELKKLPLDHYFEELVHTLTPDDLQ